MSEGAFRRLLSAVREAQRRGGNDDPGRGELKTILEQALERRQAALASGFGRTPTERNPLPGPAGLIGRLSRTHRAYTAAVASLRDDNELDVHRHDVMGRRRLTVRLAERMILDDAETAGRIAALA